MPLRSIADQDGDVTFTSDGDVVLDADPNRTPEPNEYGFESTCDPALDRILLRCHVIEMQVRQLSADVAAMKALTQRAIWVAVGALIVLLIIEAMAG